MAQQQQQQQQQPSAIYFEKQVARLCGVHCINTLLQGSYFTEVDLAQVAQELDRQEKKLMMEMGTETPEFLKFMAEDSGNVDDSGDYSIQVLQQCLAGWDLKCTPVTNPAASDALSNPLKCGLKWYNLNSLNDHPELLSDFYLSLYLATLVNSGWSIFVVRGDLPPVTTSTITSEGGEWVPVELCTQKKTAPKGEKDNKGEKGNTKTTQNNTEQDELAKAIALSLANSLSSINSTNSTSSSSSSKNVSSADEEDDEDMDDNDAELKAALEASELEAAIAASLRKD